MSDPSDKGSQYPTSPIELTSTNGTPLPDERVVAVHPPQPVQLEQLQNEITRLNQIVNSLTQAAQPPLRHLASNSDLDTASIQSWNMPSNYTGTFSGRSNHTRLSSLTTLTEQRHPGKPGTNLGRIVQTPENSNDEGDVDNIKAKAKVVRPESAETVVNPDQMGTVTTKIEGGAPLDSLPGAETAEYVHPSGLPLALLMLGICLSVFLISVDRTIITTVSIGKHYILDLPN